MRQIIGIRRGLLGLAAACLLLGTGRAQTPPAPATLTIHANQKTVTVPPTLYGVFFEEINHAGEGGLYAELVQNRSFRETNRAGLTGWQMLAPPGAKVALDTAKPLSWAHPVSLHLAPGQSVANSGFWGVPVQSGAKYKLSLWARGTGGFTVRLQSANGQVYARKTFGGLHADWKKFDATLTAGGDDTQARLVVSTDTASSASLSLVSLFPADTYKKRANGLRRDLAQMVADIKPAFMRFPGGNYIEGISLRNAFYWKTTVGDLTARPGHQNDAWGYWSTDGLGFHEFLQYCEDMGAVPMFGAHAGLGLGPNNQVPMSQLHLWVQEALDAIEYANGPVTTTWGAARARNGHPRPFGLKYLEIGNENGYFGNASGGTKAEYTERYKEFYNAIKAKYPEIQCIATTRVDAPMDIVDDHYYNSPDWFWNNANRYDRAPRNGTKVFVGEYAVTRDAGQGNLKAALGEAAFMLGMERNADMITLASYAPLFVNTNNRAWNPDAIVYDNARSYGTPSYYVQKLLANHRPDSLLAVDTQIAAPPAVPNPQAVGSIGLGTWNTEAEYKDIEVTQNGKVVYSSVAPAADAPQWTPLSGDWKLTDGVWHDSGKGTDHKTWLPLPALANTGDYTVRLKARKISGDEGFLILFHTRDASHYNWWNVGGWQNTGIGFERRTGAGGGMNAVDERVGGKIETGRWYEITLGIKGNTFTGFLDGKQVQSVVDAPPQRVAVNAGRVDKDGTLIVKVVNGQEAPLTASVVLDGVASVEPTGEAITLTSGNVNDENSLAQPTRIAPVTTKISGIAPRFSYTFPARSLTILRLKAKAAKP